MSLSARVAVAAALAVVVVGGVLLFRPGGGPNVGTTRATPSITPTSVVTASPGSTPSAIPSLPPRTLLANDTGRVLQPGSYKAVGFAIPLSITLPAGWVTNGFKPHDLVLRNDTDNAFLAVVVMKSVYPDPCHTSGKPTAVAPGVDALVNAFSAMKGFSVSGLKDATVGGARGKSFVLVNKIDLRASNCSNHQVLWIGRDGDDAPVLETAQGSDALWVVDASGTTVLIGGPTAVVNAISFGSAPN